MLKRYAVAPWILHGAVDECDERTRDGCILAFPMIGRTEPVGHFEVVDWARRQAVEKNLKPIEAHVLLLLATRANKHGVAWPSVATLADEAGVKRTGHRSSTISRALRRLEDVGAIWSDQGGNGRPGRRELLFNPATDNVFVLPAVSLATPPRYRQ